jgi:hypothetical protein
VIERIAVALLVGFFGFFIGLFMWRSLSDIPGFTLQLFFPLSVVLGVVGFLLGLWRSTATIDLFGLLGEKAWSFSTQVLSWFRFLR